ncbi:ancestral coatomer element 1, Sec16/Sec31 [Artemisia annua]|uniref:Ancestral coatomer element 1, Sec16/Sec31 n=1 Tax=Artemisia annua TaxID=35608 RepID=A0A2U1LVR9_ARTAN|nr:ancestral coatomer element 1, Sec16/Sec31 [Artemisia annua]
MGKDDESSSFQQTVQTGHQMSYRSTAWSSSARHPPHALVTFDFGRKFSVMKDASALGEKLHSGKRNRREGSWPPKFDGRNGLQDIAAEILNSPSGKQKKPQKKTFNELDLEDKNLELKLDCGLMVVLLHIVRCSS